MSLKGPPRSWEQGWRGDMQGSGHSAWLSRKSHVSLKHLGSWATPQTSELALSEVRPGTVSPGASAAPRGQGRQVVGIHPALPNPGHQAGLRQRHVWRVSGQGRDLLVSVRLIGLIHQDSSTLTGDSGGERKPMSWPAGRGVSRPAPAMSFSRSPTRKWVSHSSPFSC